MKIERTDNYEIHSYNCDMNGRLTLPDLNKFLQETAWKNAVDMNLGFDEMIHDNRAWVLFKLYMKMNDMPSWGDKIKLKTMLSDTDKLFCYREFEMYKDDLLLGRVSSSWLVIDIITRKPVRLAFIHQDQFELNKQIFFPEVIKKRMKHTNSPEQVYQKKVMLTDIDINHHVNNSLYPQWCLNAYEYVFFMQHKIVASEQQFSAEAKLGDQLDISMREIGYLLFEHCILKDNKPLFIMKLQWEKSG